MNELYVYVGSIRYSNIWCIFDFSSGVLLWYVNGLRTARFDSSIALHSFDTLHLNMTHFASRRILIVN